MGARTRGHSAVVGGVGRHDSRLATLAGLFAFTTAIFIIFVPPARAQTAAAPETAASPPAKSKSTATIPWSRVPDRDKKVLTPLESQWSSLPGTQQRRLLGAAKHYPTLTPVEQERFQERLKSWSTLTPEQRVAARDKYQSLSKLPSAKQDELKARWQQAKQGESQPKDAAPAAAPAPTAK